MSAQLSQLFTSKNGATPTVFTFDKNPNILFGGKVTEVGKLKKKYGEAFKVDIKYFEKRINFVQLMKLKHGQPTTLAGTVEYTVCTDE